MAKASQFLRIFDQDGELVAGDSFAHGHAREIDLTGWDWSIEDPSVPVKGEKAKAKAAATNKVTSKLPTGGDSSNKKPQPSIFSFTKSTDRSTTRLLSAMDNGEIFSEVVLFIEEQFQESAEHLPFHLEAHLSKVFVVDFKWQASVETAGFSLSETWQFNYDKIHFHYHWRGGNAAWIHQELERKPDAKDGASEKSPLSSAEQAEARRKEFDNYMKKNKQK